MKVYSAFTYNGEIDMLRLHLNILGPYVDRFIIVEANKTFTGKDKPMYFFQQERYVEPFWKKISYYAVTDWKDKELWSLAHASPNTRGAEHWAREFYIKENVLDALRQEKLHDEDLCLVGDVDEILDPTISFASDGPIKARLRVYAYYLDNLSDEQFWGTLVAQYKDIKGQCLNHMRSDKSLYSKGDYLGWHFTSMGGEAMVRRKLNDSYTAQSYNTPEVQQMLSERLSQGKDYLGRPFNFKLDTTDWPDYLKAHHRKFDHLCYPKSR